ncbi:MAG: hypothetical protein LKJ83_04960 [Eubacteriaceae bacterium]|nr:hypothetical protein [Eubacteriaceae bacterium]
MTTIIIIALSLIILCLTGCIFVMRSEMEKRIRAARYSAQPASTSSSSATVKTGTASGPAETSGLEMKPAQDAGLNDEAAGTEQTAGTAGTGGTAGPGGYEAGYAAGLAAARASSGTDEEEITAVIAAAVAAYGGPNRKLVIRNIRRLQGGSSAWESSGRMDLLN